MELIHSGQKLSINIIKDDKLIEIIGVITEVLDDRISVELPKYFMRYYITVRRTFYNRT